MLLLPVGENGLLHGSAMVFESTSGSTGDYHRNMDAKRFLEYIKEQVLPNISENSVLIIDKASYHMTKTGKIQNYTFYWFPNYIATKLYFSHFSEMSA